MVRQRVKPCRKDRSNAGRQKTRTDKKRYRDDVVALMGADEGSPEDEGRGDPLPRAPHGGRHASKLDFISLTLLFLGLMSLLWAISPPGSGDIAYRMEMRLVMLFLSVVSLVGFMFYFRQADAREMMAEDPTRISTEFMTDEELEEVRRDWTVAERFIDLFTLSGALKPYIPYAGLAIITADIAWNIYRSDEAIAVYDGSVIALGLMMTIYNRVPVRYSRERDFGFLFFFFMCLFFVYISYFIVEPIREAERRGGNAAVENPSPIVQYLLAEPVAAILRILGVDAQVNGEVIIYENRFDETGKGAVAIGYGCTGIYSVFIFLSMYLSFIMSEYRKVTRRMGALIVFGVLMAFVANLIRMVIIILTGVYYGPDALYWAHKEVGWMIFMAWVFVFWWGSSRMLDRRDG